MKIKAIFFDVFGTVFDWHKSIHDEAKKFTIENKITFDEFYFTDRWREGFRNLQSKVASGNRNYLSMDDIHFEVLLELFDELKIEPKKLNQKPRKREFFLEEEYMKFRAINILFFQMLIMKKMN